MTEGLWLLLFHEADIGEYDGWETGAVRCIGVFDEREVALRWPFENPAPDGQPFSPVRYWVERGKLRSEEIGWQATSDDARPVAVLWSFRYSIAYSPQTGKPLRARWLDDGRWYELVPVTDLRTRNRDAGEG